MNVFFLLFADERLLQTVRGFFIAGTETTATTLRWALLFLIRHKDVQTKMRREIEEVVGSGRFPTMADKANLPFCEAVALEIQRRGNVAAQGLPRGVKYDGLFGFFLRN